MFSGTRILIRDAEENKEKTNRTQKTRKNRSSLLILFVFTEKLEN